MLLKGVLGFTSLDRRERWASWRATRLWSIWPGIVYGERSGAIAIAQTVPGLKMMVQQCGVDEVEIDGRTF